ncbi:hypothetical protein HAX54_026114 [Datura stramonium]|uniref:Uncharacterized protein n=1 Tax=Datura stramonium TaxID=4076 RepID=A0ABS8V3P7_DATST|nr:hypothetical protein [Datura stramonium]
MGKVGILMQEYLAAHLRWIPHRIATICFPFSGVAIQEEGRKETAKSQETELRHYGDNNVDPPEKGLVNKKKEKNIIETQGKRDKDKSYCHCGVESKSRRGDG